MTGIRELIRQRPVLAAFVAAAIVAGAAAGALHGPIERALRMQGDELVTVSQGVDLEKRATHDLSELKSFVDGSGSGVRYEDVADFRMKLQAVNLEMHTIHFPQDAERKGRETDPFADLDDRLHARGVVLGNAIAMLRVWEHEIRAGNAEGAAAARETIRGILIRNAPDMAGAPEDRDGTPRSVLNRS